MPYCASPFCSNSTSKGFRLFAFPRDPVKREKWRQNCGRGDDWKPSKNHKLCEVHFDDDQYETRALTYNGNRKLKPCAIPTVFPKSRYLGGNTRLKKALLIKDSSSKRNQKSKAKNISDHTQQNTDETEINVETGEQDMPVIINARNNLDVQDGESSCVASTKIQHFVDATTSTHDLEETTRDKDKNIYEIKMEKLLNKVVTQCTTIRQLKRKLLKTQRQMNVQFDCVNKIFTPDQLKALRYTTRGRFEWSEETIKRSVHLRLACGPKGYNYLVSVGYPFPSYRTLCSRAEPPKQPQLLEYRIENIDAPAES